MSNLETNDFTESNFRQNQRLNDMADVVNGLIAAGENTRYSNNTPQLFADFSDPNLDDFLIDSGTPDIATIEIDPVTGRQGLHIKTKAGEFTSFTLPQMVGTFYQRQVFVISRETPQTVQQRMTLRVTESGSNFWNHFCEYGTPSLNNPSVQGGAVTRLFNAANRNSSGTPSSGDFNALSYRVQIQPDAGQVIETWIFGVGLGTVRKGRICVVWDDNRASAHKFGIPVMNSKNIKQTIGLILSTVGKTTYGNLNQLKTFVGQGHSVVSHGVNSDPNGAGSLITAFGTDYDAALADIKLANDYIQNNNLQTPNYEKCYIFPQGAYQPSVNDTGLLEKMHNVGIVVGRTSFRVDVKLNKVINSLSKFNRLCVPTIGHQWAGTTAAEATNIANVVTNIQQCALYGLDCFLMLHTVVPTSTVDASLTDYDIRISDLTTIADAIKVEVDAGRLQTVTMPELVNLNDFWGQI